MVLQIFIIFVDFMQKLLNKESGQTTLQEILENCITLW